MDTDIKKGRHRIFSSRVFSGISKNPHSISRVTFFTGFLLDTLTLPRIDVSIVHILIFTYLCIAGLSIFLVQFFIARTPRSSRLVTALPYVIQFTFGALLSALFLYYFRSASFAGSWVFLLVLGGISIGNEFLRTRYRLLEFQLSVYFIIFFAFMIFYVPILFKHIGIDTFIVAGGVSLVVLSLLIFFLLRVIPYSERGRVRKKIAFGIGMSYVLFNALYFTHIIPPIPLVLKQADAYHFVSRDEYGRYVGLEEQRGWYERYVSYVPTYRLNARDAIYFFSAVFAPTALQTPIVHEWQYLDPESDSWITRTEIKFPITGGREEGYRAYSMKNNVSPGRWRVLVKTEDGAVLGRKNFRIILVDTPLLLHERAL